MTIRGIYGLIFKAAPYKIIQQKGEEKDGKGEI